MKTIPRDLFEQKAENEAAGSEGQGKGPQPGIILDKDLRLKLSKYISTFSSQKELIEVKGKLIDYIRSM